MDLSEIPHEQWDHSIQQLTSECYSSYSNDVFEFAKGDIQEYKPIFENEVPQIETLLNPQLQSGAFNTQNVEQSDFVAQSIIPLAIAYYPDLSESVQGFEAPSDPSEFLSNNTHNEIPTMEESFADNLLALTSFDPDYNTGGVSVISPFTDPYPESLNRWLRQFTRDGLETSSDEMYSTTATSACGPSLSENNYQSNPSEWAPSLLEENELSGLSANTYMWANTDMWAPQLALTDGRELIDIESSWPSIGEERESVVVSEERESVSVLRMTKNGGGVESESKKKGKGRRAKSREERDSERVIREMKESERRRSSRVSKPPARYIEEWSKKPKRARKLASKCPKNESGPLKKNSKIYLVPKAAEFFKSFKH